MSFGGAYYDGRTARRHPVDLSVEGGVLTVSGAGIRRAEPLRHVRISERLGQAPRLLHFGDGAYCEVRDHAALDAALAEYEAKRRPEKEKLIGASEISAMWYEEFPRWMDAYGPYEFVYRYMTRTGRISLDRLRAQFPDLVREIEASGELPELAGA